MFVTSVFSSSTVLKQNKKIITFFIIYHSHASFQKCFCDFLILKLELSFFFVIEWKNEFFTNLNFIIRKLQKIGRVPKKKLDYKIRTPLKHHFSRKKQFRLYNLNCISTNSKYVCNLDSHFMDNIDLFNSHPSISSHC